MKESKQSLRARALLRMENISTAEFITWNRTIQERVLNLRAYLQSQSIALYSSIGKEVTTDQIRDHAQFWISSIRCRKSSGPAALAFSHESEDRFVIP